MPATVIATLKTTGNAVLQGNAFIRFRLRNFAGFVPRVQSTGVIAEPIIDAFPDSSGDISQSVYMNSEIIPNTTFYTIEFHDQGRITSSGNYLINGATDLDSASQLNSPPVPPGFELVLQNSGQDNSSQNLLNLTSDDASVTIVDLGNGQIDLSGGGGGSLTINSQTGTTYTLTLTDAGKCVEMNNVAANTLTVPPNSSAAFPIGTILTVRQQGAGQTTIAAGAGVTINTPETLLIRSQYGWVTLHKRATNEWNIEGNLQVAP